MSTPNLLFHLARADFLERARRSSFLLILAAAIVMGILVNNGTLLVDLGSPESTRHMVRYRGEFNSAWIGMMTVLVANLFLSLIGFYLVNDCVKRDMHTGVGQIIATTPVRRATYLLGKWISNFAVLAVLVLILAVAALIMVLLQSETALDPGALLMPFIAVALPNMALTAALAVLFETVPWLRGAMGNVVYFFLWLLPIGMSLGGGGLSFLPDPMGFTVFSASLTTAARAAFPDQAFSGISIGGAPGFTHKVFPWSGLDWTPGVVGGQWMWAAFGLGLILLSTAWFARFDPSREGPKRARRRRNDADHGEPAKARNRIPRIAPPGLSLLVSKLAQATPFLGVLCAELRLLLKGRRWWWWLLLAGLSAALFVSPFTVAKGYLLPIAWLWPLPVWSAMGNRERKNNTWPMVYASPRPVLRQIPAAWLAGVLATALLGIVQVVFLASSGDLAALAGWTVAVVFVPTLALTLGVVSSGSRVFEVAYTIWWYVGPMQKMQGLDFLHDAPLAYAPAAAGLLLLAALWRAKQVRAQD